MQRHHRHRMQNTENRDGFDQIRLAIECDCGPHIDTGLVAYHANPQFVTRCTVHEVHTGVNISVSLTRQIAYITHCNIP